MTAILNKTINLFNAVQAKPVDVRTPYVNLQYGFIVAPEALWALPEIIAYYKENEQTMVELNQTFHKSIKVVLESTEEELIVQQILHYISKGLGNGTLYVPAETLFVADQKLRIPFTVIKGLSLNNILGKCKALLNGISLEQDTITDVLDIYDAYGDLNQLRRIANKEATVILADKYDILPIRPEEVLRLAVYKATGKTLLIKNAETYEAIRSSYYDPKDLFEKIGLASLASVFNRFKGIFLSFKHVCPSTINIISRLAAKRVAPVKMHDPLDMVLWETINNPELIKNAPIGKLLQCYTVTSLPNCQSVKLYKVRNGKAFVKPFDTHRYDETVVKENRETIVAVLKERLSHLNGSNVFLNRDLKYGIPMSMKNFVGNLPEGTRYSSNHPMIGVYWRNDGGAIDLDISAIGLDGETVGWHSNYKNKDLVFSGDMTSAPNGAAEYVIFDNPTQPYIIYNNVFEGSKSCTYSVICGDKEKYVTDDHSVIADDELLTSLRIKTCKGKQSIIGLFLPENKEIILMNWGVQNTNMSSASEVTKNTIIALQEYYSNVPTLEDLLKEVGANIQEEVNTDTEYVLSEPIRSDFVDLLKL